MWLLSCFGCGVAPFVFPCAGLLGQLRVRLVFRAVIHEGLAARQGGSLREITLRDLPDVKGLGKFGVQACRVMVVVLLGFPPVVLPFWAP